jgi:hypothetical protein
MDNPPALGRVSQMDRQPMRVRGQQHQTGLYHTDYNPYFKQNTTLWNATDFIAALTQFVPPWGVRYVRYYGLYSSRCKARWHHLPHIARLAPAALNRQG